MLKSNFFKNKTKNQKNKQTKKNLKKNTNFQNHFLSSFLICMPVLATSFAVHINTIHRVWVTLINERQQETRGLLGKKRIPWNNPIAGVMSAS